MNLLVNLRSCRTVVLIAFLAWLLLPVSPVSADQPPAAVTATPGYSEQATALRDEIQASKRHIAELETRLEQKQGVAAMILESRIQDEIHRVLDLSHQLCQLVIDRVAANEDPGPFRETAQELLQLIPERVRIGAQRQLASIENRADLTALSATEQIASEDERAELSKRLLASYSVLMRNLQLSERLSFETEQQVDFLRQALAEAAENQSIGLELARRYGKIVERQSRALPEDTELAAKVRVSGERIKRLNDALRQLVELMKQLDMRTVEYRQQLVAVTGTVTTDILDFEVFIGMLQRWLHRTIAWSKVNLPGIGFNLLLFLLIVWGAVTVSRLSRRLVESGLNRRPSSMSQLLQRMIISSVGNIVLILGLLFGLAQLGISVGPLLAGLGIAGFIVGFALQDTLGNFASGMLILFYRPYDVGDFIETNGVLGKVSRMSLVNTTVLTIDN